ncbi:MAG: helicase C-terminal domain-containing protein [Anaerolineales bacterium]|jgi:ATP-dependent DNA helicase DinG
MPLKPLIAFDLETSGLDPQRDSVIEVGAVRFRGDRVDAEWSTLVNPGHPLSPFITELTGITDEMLAAAPRIDKVLPELEAFIGDDPILGHNVSFDTAFMQVHGLFQYNATVDTFDLASILRPHAGRYSLQSLATALHVPVREAHRALDDAHTTRSVFMRLYGELLEIPFSLIEEIARLGEEIEWGAGWVFDQAYRTLLEQGKKRSSPPLQLFTPAEEFSGELEPVDTPVGLDIEEIAAEFEPGGLLAKHFPGYENRPQQVSMVRAVARALSENGHLLVEAGTGTGKSMAYLVPAIHWSTQNGQRVVISTNTLNLQDQLVHKDIPDLKQALALDFQAGVLKGRANYLCPRRFNALRSLGPRQPEEMRVLAKLLLWLADNGSGERSELNLPPGEAGVWSRLSAEGEDCSMETCATHAGGTCPYYKARLRAEGAHLVIVNHALLLADIATGNRVVPEYEYLIVDEAHHLESATTNGLSFRVTEPEVLRVLRDLGGTGRGLVRQILDLARTNLPPGDFAGVEAAVSAVTDRIELCMEHARALFTALNLLLENQREGEAIGPYGQTLRVIPATRTLPDWEKVEIVWEDFRGPLATTVEMLGSLSDSLESMAEDGLEPAENLSVAARIARRSLNEMFTQLDQMIFEPDPGMIYWIELTPVGERLSLHAAPLEIGPLVERYLWHEKESVIMTSATLTTAGEFDYIRRRLHADDADELAVGSPFDHETSTLLYLLNDMPEPQQRQAYQKALEFGLRQLLLATEGRALVLFTSNAHLRSTANALSEPLARAGIQLYEQTSGVSRHALLEGFKTTAKSVLMGTRSFWEGVDVPGEALSVLAIAKLPFDVPSDPIIASRAETYERPFDEYTVPEAILRFRQGFGRLIRTRSDRGIVVVFDRRILSKNYGRAFIESLPRCTTRAASLADLPRAATRWLNL